MTRTEERPFRIWYWRNADGNWFMELRYGKKVMKLSGESTAVEVGQNDMLTAVIATLLNAVRAGELGKAMALAKNERMATLGKR